MHTWFLTIKKRGSFDANVITPSRANALLKKADIDVHELDAYLPSELGEILGVDYVVMGAFGTTQTAVCNIDFITHQTMSLL